MAPGTKDGRCHYYAVLRLFQRAENFVFNQKNHNFSMQIKITSSRSWSRNIDRSCVGLFLFASWFGARSKSWSLELFKSRKLEAGQYEFS